MSVSHNNHFQNHAITELILHRQSSYALIIAQFLKSHKITSMKYPLTFQRDETLKLEVNMLQCA